MRLPVSFASVQLPFNPTGSAVRLCSVGLSCVVLATICAGVADAQLGSAPSELREGPFGPFGPPVTGGEFGYSQVAADFDGDGYDDLAVARLPEAYESSAYDLTYVLRGGPTGLTFWQTLSQFQQNGFGAALAACDLDGDGDDDLIVGAPLSEVEGQNEAGLVAVYMGDPQAMFLQQTLTRDDLGQFISGDERFGASLATGDFDGDGECDVAIGAPEDEDAGVRGSTVGAGSVSVVFGLGNGSLGTSDYLHLRESLLPTPGGSPTPGAHDHFGFSLATARSPERHWLVVGVPDKDGTTADAGRVWLIGFDGRNSLADGTAAVDFADTASARGVAGSGVQFGFAVSAGRYGESGMHVAVGAPGYSSATTTDMGAVFIVDLDTFGALSSVHARIDQDIPDLGSTPFNNEQFGSALLTSDVDRDGWDDLLVSAPYDRDESAGARGTQSIGSVHVLFGGPGQARIENRFGSQVTDDRVRFGESLAVGNFTGAGGEAVSVGAPRVNAPEVGARPRGIGEGDWHGAIYVYPSTLTTPSTSLLAQTDTTPLGDGWQLVELSDAARTATGQPGYRGVFAQAELQEQQTRVVVDGVERERTSDVECAEGEAVAEGFALHSTTVFGYRDRVEQGCPELPSGEVGFVAGGEFVATELTPVSGGAVGTPSQPLATDEGRIYFRGSDVFGTSRILRTAAGGAGPFEVVLAEGDTVEDGSQFVKAIDYFDVSENGSHLLYSGVLGSIADFEAVVLGDERVLTPNTPIPASSSRGSSAPTVQTFNRVAVDDAGTSLVAARDQNLTWWVVRGAQGTLTSAIEAPAVAPEPDLQPLALSLTDGVALHLWGVPIMNRGAVNREVIPARPTWLLASCSEDLEQSVELLRSGDLIDIDGGAPVEVMEMFEPNSSEGLELGEDRRVYLRIAARRGADAFEAIIGLDVPCPLFADGFESGDTQAWN